MPNEQWQQVKEIFDAALRHEAGERPKFLNKACGDDQTLRREVESLLSSLDHADGFMAQPVVGEMPDAVTIKSTRLIKGQTLGHYKIVELIGSGGMGEVYLARDTLLKRNVAVKLLLDVRDKNDDHLRRFFQEARAASALNHPNILTIHEIGQTDGTHFIAAEYVNGETLRERLKRERLSLTDALEIAVQIAAALSAAHEAGIIHRDVKPENVMIRKDGLVKVLDFGLAKLTTVSRKTPDREASTRAHVETNPGVILGTVAYMSPEQARAGELDGRTDIFSFGVVLYEMLAGRMPFAGETTSDVMAAILKNEPAPLAGSVSDIPRDLERLVNKCLRKNREQRYQHIKDVLIDLKDLKHDLEFASELERTDAPTRKETATVDTTAAVTETQKPQTTSSAKYLVDEVKQRKAVSLGVLLVLLVAIGGLGFWYFSNRIADTQLISSIAVLPFVNESGNADMEYLSDGMTESLINRLSQIPNLSVKARNTVFRYKGKDTNTVARELNVQAVLTGRLVQRGDELTLFLELIDATTENQLWGKQYNRKMTNLVALQTEIALDVSDSLKTRLSGADEQKLAKKYTENAEAYQLYLRGRFHWNKRDVPEMRKSVEFFQQAVTVDPNYALGYAGLADAYSQISQFGNKEPKVLMPKAKEAALKAIALDAQLAEAHAALGLIIAVYDYDFAGATREIKRAIELNPNYGTALHYYSRVLNAQGRHDEALAENRRALEIDPLSLPFNWVYGLHLLYARKYDEAIAQLKKTQELDANFLPARNRLILAYWMKGDYAKFVEEDAKSDEQNGRPQDAAFSRENFARGGWQGYARAWLEKIPDMGSYSKALYYAELGEKDKAFAALDKTYEERTGFAMFVKVEPRLDPLRDDPRFQELLRRVGLPP